MESSNKFKKGLNQDIHPAEQIPQTYRNAVNFVLLSQEGNIYTITNEDGTTLFDRVSFPTGKQIVGYYVLNNDVIVILAGLDGTSQIGYIRESTVDLDPDYGLYRPVAPIVPGLDIDTTPARDLYPEDNTEFGFSIDHPVDCQARKLINGNRVLYYTDNLNPFGRIELEDAPTVGSVKEQSRLVFNQSIPTINFVEMQEEVSGSLNPGVYQFITRYVTSNGGVTSFGIPSDLISVVPTNKTGGVDAYSGKFYDDEIVNKNIILSIDNVDQNYRELEIIVAYYAGGTTFNARSISRIPITGDTISFTFTGPETGEEIAITREELRQVPVSYKRAKAIEQKDNTLFLSNLSDDSTDDNALQSVANHITVEYQVDEVAYSGREGDVIGDVDSDLFDVVNITLSGPADVVVNFNKEVDFESFTLGVENSTIVVGAYGSESHSLTKNGEPATGKIDHAATALGDTVVIDGVTFLSVAAVTSPETEFELDADPSITAANLAVAVNSDNLRDFTATTINDGTIKTLIVWRGIGGEGELLAYTGGISGDASLTGELLTVAPYDVTDMQLTGPSQITYSFTGPVQISEADVLSSFRITSGSGVETISINDNVTIGVADVNENTTDAAEQGFTDFLDEKVGFDKRGYRRGEVYSLGFMLLYKDGSTSFVYHIPGTDKTVVPTGKHYGAGTDYNTGDTTGELGTYLSENFYPLKQNYPGNEIGDELISPTRSIRHHIMPTLTQEPHYRDRGGNNAFVRTLGLKFTLDPAFDIPDLVKEDVQEIIFVRERRNSDLNKSVLSQGFINRLVETADHCNISGEVEGTAIDGVNADYCLQEMPFFNNLESMLVSGDSRRKSSGHSYRGACWPGASEEGFGINRTFANGRKLNTQIRGNRAFFHTPESILSVSSGLSPEAFVGATMKPWLLMTGKAHSTAKAPCEYEGEAGDDFCTYYGYQDLHGTYTGYDVSFAYSENNNRDIGGAANRSPGVRRHGAILGDNNFPSRTTTKWTQGGWELFVTNPTAATAYDPTNPHAVEHSFIDGAGEKLYLDHEVRSWDRASFCLSDCNNAGSGGYVKSSTTDIIPGTIDIKNHLYNLETDNKTQYGQLGSATYIIAGRYPLQTIGTSYGTVYSGDTYITKFGVNTGGLLFYYPYLRYLDSSRNVPDATSSRRGYGALDGGKAEGYDFRTCHYYFVESDINTYYRHRPDEETRQNYFPNQKSPGLNLSQFFAYLGNIRAYNGLYSFENNLKEFFTKGSTQQVVTAFENRTIYSEMALSDSVIDSYRSFLVNNYYDLPSHTGPIWDTFVQSNTLYMHTPKSCWRTFAEPSATLSGGNISDVVLGTGALFARPSTEVLTTEGGYAGTISQYGGSQTPMGYIFPDILQGKVFVLGAGGGGPMLKDLGLEGLYTYFHQNMSEGITSIGGISDLANVTTSNAYLIDNPYNNIGFLGGYDHKLKRAWLIKQGTLGFNVSYSTLMQSWSSFHTYNPNVVIPFDNRTFFMSIEGDTSVMWEMNTGAKGDFFGTVDNSELEISVPIGEGGTFNNQIVHAESTDGRTKVRDDFFETLQVKTDRHNTGVLPFVSGNGFDPTKLDGEVFYKFRNDEYRIAVPRDSVFDNGGDIDDLDNIYEPQGGTVPVDDDYATRERIKGDYGLFKYIYNNVPNYNFVLREIRSIFEKNFR